MQDPLFDTLGSLVRTTAKMGQMGPQIKGEEVALPEAPPVGPDQLQSLVAPEQTPAPEESKWYQAPRSEPEMSLARGVQQIPGAFAQAPEALWKGLQAGAGAEVPPGSPLVPETLTFWSDMDPIDIAQREVFQKYQAETSITEEAGRAQAAKVAQDERDYQDEMRKISAIIAVPVGQWSDEEEDVIRTMLGPKWLKTWKESSFEEKMSGRDARRVLELGPQEPVTGDDRAEALRLRRFLRRAAYFKFNPVARAMSEMQSIRGIFRADNQDLEALSDAAASLKEVTFKEGISDEEKVDAYRGILVEYLGNVKDAEGNVRGPDEALKMFNTPNEVVKKAKSIMASEGALAKTELSDRRTGLWRAVRGFGNLLDPEKAKRSSVTGARARRVPPIETMAKIYKVRNQLPREFTIKDIIANDPTFDMIARHYYEQDIADENNFAAAAESIMEFWYELYSVPDAGAFSGGELEIDKPRGAEDFPTPTSAGDRFGSTSLAALFNYSIPIPESQWDGWTWEVNGRPLLPMRDHQYFEVMRRLEEMAARNIADPNMHVYMTPWELRRFKADPLFAGNDWQAYVSGLEPEREFKITRPLSSDLTTTGLGPDSIIADNAPVAVRNMKDELFETSLCDPLPLGVRRRLATSGFTSWGRYLSLGMTFPDVEWEGAGIKVTPLPPGGRGEFLLNVNSLADQEAYEGQLMRVFKACDVAPELMFRMPWIDTYTTLAARLDADESLRSGSILKEILSVRYVMGMNAERADKLSWEEMKAWGLMLRTGIFNGIMGLLKIGAEIPEQAARVGAERLVSATPEIDRKTGEVRYSADQWLKLRLGPEDDPVVSVGFPLRAHHEELAEKAEKRGDYWRAAVHRDEAREYTTIGKVERDQRIHELSIFADGLSWWTNHMISTVTDTDYFKKQMDERPPLLILDLMGVADTQRMAGRGVTKLAAAKLRAAGRLSKAWGRVGYRGSLYTGSLTVALKNKRLSLDTFRPHPNMESRVLSGSLGKKTAEGLNALDDMLAANTAKALDTPEARSLMGTEQRLEAITPKHPLKAKTKEDYEVPFGDAETVEGTPAQHAERLLKDMIDGDLDVWGARKSVPGLEGFPPVWKELFRMADEASRIASGRGTWTLKTTTEAGEAGPPALTWIWAARKGPTEFVFQQLDKKIRSAAQLGGSLGRAMGAVMLARQEQMGTAFKHTIEAEATKNTMHIQLSLDSMVEAAAILHVDGLEGGMGTVLNYLADAFRAGAEKNATRQHWRMMDLLESDLEEINVSALRDTVKALLGDDADLELTVKEKRSDKVKPSELLDHTMIRIRKQDGSFARYEEVAEVYQRFTEPRVEMLKNSPTFQKLTLDPDGAFANKFYEDTGKIEGALKGRLGRTAKENIARLRKSLGDDKVLKHLLTSPEALRTLRSPESRKIQKKIVDMMYEALGGGSAKVWIRMDSGGEIHNVPLKQAAEVLSGEQIADIAPELVLTLLDGPIDDPRVITLDFVNEATGKEISLGLDDLGLVRKLGKKWIATKSLMDILTEKQAAYAVSMEAISNETLAGRMAWLRQAHDAASKSSNQAIFVVVKGHSKADLERMAKKRISYDGSDVTSMELPSMTVHNLFDNTRKSIFLGNELDDVTKAMRMGMEEEYPVFYDAVTASEVPGEAAKGLVLLFGDDETGRGRMTGTKPKVAESSDARYFATDGEQRPSFFAQELADDRFVLKWANGERKGRIVTESELGEAFYRYVAEAMVEIGKTDAGKPITVSLLDHTKKKLFSAIRDTYKDNPGKFDNMGKRKGWINREIAGELYDRGVLTDRVAGDSVFLLDIDDNIGNKLSKIADGKELDTDIVIRGATLNTPHKAFDLREHLLGRYLYGDPENAAKALNAAGKVGSGRADAIKETFQSDAKDIENAAYVAGVRGNLRRRMREKYNLLSASGDPIGAIRKGLSSMDPMAVMALVFYWRRGELPKRLLSGFGADEIVRQWSDAGFWQGDVSSGGLTTFGRAGRLVRTDFSRRFYQTLFARSAVDASKMGHIGKLWNYLDLLGPESRGVMYALEDLNNDIRGSLTRNIARHFSSNLYSGENRVVAARMFDYLHKSYLDIFNSYSKENDPSSGMAMDAVVRSAKTRAVKKDPTKLAVEDTVPDNFATAAAWTNHVLDYRMSRIEMMQQLVRDGHVLPASTLRVKADPWERVDELKAEIAKAMDRKSQAHHAEKAAAAKAVRKLIAEKDAATAAAKEYTDVYHVGREPTEVRIEPGKIDEWVVLDVKNTGIDDEAGRLVFGDIWSGDELWYIRRAAADTMRVSSANFADVSGWQLVGRQKRRAGAKKAAIEYTTKEGATPSEKLAYNFQFVGNQTGHMFADFIEYMGQSGDAAAQRIGIVSWFKHAKLFHAFTAPTVRNFVTNLAMLSVLEPRLINDPKFWTNMWDYATRIRPGFGQSTDAQLEFLGAGLGGYAAAKKALSAEHFSLNASKKVNDYYGRRTLEVEQAHLDNMTGVYKQVFDATNAEHAWGDGFLERLRDRGGEVAETLDKNLNVSKGWQAYDVGVKKGDVFIRSLLRVHGGEVWKQILESPTMGAAYDLMNDMATHVTGLGASKRMPEMDRFTRASANFFSLADEAPKWAVWIDLWDNVGPGGAIRSGEFPHLGVHGRGFRDWWDSREPWSSAERRAYIESKFFTPEQLKERLGEVQADYSTAAAPTKFVRGFAEPFVYFKAKASGMFGKFALKRPLGASALVHAGRLSWAEQLDTPEEMSVLHTHNPNRLPWIRTTPETVWNLGFMDMGLDPADLFQGDTYFPWRIFKEVAAPIVKATMALGGGYAVDTQTRVAEALRGWTQLMYGSGQINAKELAYRRIFDLGYGRNGFGQHAHDRAPGEPQLTLPQQVSSTIKRMMDEGALLGMDAGGAGWRKMAAAQLEIPHHGSPYSKALSSMDYTRALGDLIYGLSYSPLAEPYQYLTSTEKTDALTRKLKRMALSGELPGRQARMLMKMKTFPPEQRAIMEQARKRLHEPFGMKTGVGSAEFAAQFRGLEPYIDALARVWTRPEMLKKYGGGWPWISAMLYNNLKKKYPDDSETELQRKLTRTIDELQEERSREEPKNR